ncbi:MAG TPA: molybdopterin-synthase adenylyltransferase MoeB [Kineosporiaceae bacterium]|nr:molybdopterin-synthase adenylyltransferase MoeB [Kineosporiaceae bacterium]
MIALVDPAAELSVEEIRRYSRHLLLPEVSGVGQRRLKNAAVLVIGAGGLGSPVLMYLAAAGVGTIGIVDDDVVEESNLQRQVIHGQSDLGRPKVDSAEQAIAELNPHVRVVRHRVRLDRSNVLEVLGGYQLVLDGTDNFATRYLVDDACAILGLPLVWGSVLRFDGQVSLFWSAPLPDAAGVVPEPMTYRDLHPTPPPPGSVPSCAEGGVLGVVCAAIGSVMATEAVKLICGIGEPLLGRLTIFDALAMSWRTIRVRPAADRQPVRELLADYDAFCSVPAVPVVIEDGVTLEDGATSDTITAAELALRLRRRERGEDKFVLVDVREPGEWEIVRIPGAVLIPLDRLRDGRASAELTAATDGGQLVLHCKSGGRSAQALQLARAAGFADAVHLEGGVLAWIDQVDPGQPRY